MKRIKNVTTAAVHGSSRARGIGIVAAALGGLLVLAACGSSSGSGDSSTSGADTSSGTTQSQAASSGSEPAQSGELAPINFQTSFFFNGWDAPFFLALDNGYYEEAGLDVTIREGKGSADAMKTLLGGANDIVEAERTAMAIQATEIEGLRSIASLVDPNGMIILSYKDRNITKPEDLIGKTVAISLGSSEAGIIPEFLKLNGVDESAVQIENVDSSQKAQFLKSGKVDAISWQNFSAVGIDSLDKFNMVAVADYGMNLLGNGLVSTEGWLAEHGDLARAFIEATKRGWDAMIENPQSGVDALLKRTTSLSAEAALTQWEQYLSAPNDKVSSELSDPWGFQSTESWDAMLKNIETAGVVKSPKDADYYFTNEYLPAK